MRAETAEVEERRRRAVGIIFEWDRKEEKKRETWGGGDGGKERSGGSRLAQEGERVGGFEGLVLDQQLKEYQQQKINSKYSAYQLHSIPPLLHRPSSHLHSKGPKTTTEPPLFDGLFRLVDHVVSCPALPEK